MILRDDRPESNRERLATWYTRALRAGFILQLGPRFGADFDRQFARDYEREQILDSALTRSET